MRKSIMLVEDNPVDAELMIRTFHKVGLSVPVVVCETGDEGLDYLESTLKRSDRDIPQMIFLDLNLPGLDGREVLQTIKENPSISSVPIIVLSTSNDEHDIEACYRNGANSFLIKPDNPNDYVSMFQKFKEYWFDTVKLPLLTAM